MGTVEYKEALYKAKRALQKYYTENHLNPAKDYSKDPIHGDMVTNLILRLNRERDKLERKYPIIKIKSNLKRLRIMTKKVKEAKASKKVKEAKASKKEKKAAIAEVENKKTKKTSKKKAPKEKKENTKKPTKYDYPLIDGREMNSLEKKKYRMEQRKLKAKDGKDTSESKKEHKEKKTSKKPVTKEVSNEKKDLKKKKKVKKEED